MFDFDVGEGTGMGGVVGGGRRRLAQRELWLVGWVEARRGRVVIGCFELRAVIVPD